MKNVLNYYYNLYPTSIHQINNSYKCFVDNDEYLLTPYYGDLKMTDKIYQISIYLHKFNIPCHQVILNTSGQILTLINNVNYILLRIFVKNREINVDDILIFSSLYVDSKYFYDLVKDNWYEMWTRKIDYFEYQVSQFGIRYKIIRDSINYYIGLAENSISLFTSVNNSNQLVIGHRRIKSSSGVLEFYNPLNFIIDNRIRDLSEYIKEQFFFSKYSIEDAKRDISRFNLTNSLYILLFVRLLFPSYYFDCYESILHDNKDEKELVKIIFKNDQYIIFLKELYLWFKKFVNIPDIEWLIKT